MKASDAAICAVAVALFPAIILVGMASVPVFWVYNAYLTHKFRQRRTVAR